MKLGIAATLPHSSPMEWAEKHSRLGLEAVVFPCKYTDSVKLIDQYVNACKCFNLQIAEVGAWKNPLDPDIFKQRENLQFCIGQLELADYISARCCVNISGAKGEIWDGAYAQSYSEETYCEIIASVQRIIDSASPKNTFYTLEPMPWMHPDSPEDYAQMIKDINRERFAVHMDIVNMINTPKKYLFNKEFTQEAFSLLGKHIKSCHIKDIIMPNRLTVLLEETQVGKGSLDLKNYIDLAEKCDPDMPMIIEHLNDDNAYIDAAEYIHGITK